MGAFAKLSRNVPFCPQGPNGYELGQNRTNRDKTGHFVTIRETPPWEGLRIALEIPPLQNAYLRWAKTRDLKSDRRVSKLA